MIKKCKRSGQPICVTCGEGCPFDNTIACADCEVLQAVIEDMVKGD